MDQSVEDCLVTGHMRFVSALNLPDPAEQALGRLSAMSGLVASAEWLIYSSIRKEALLTKCATSPVVQGGEG
ncbi:hypothetical protein [Acidihalobacter yilgarnensis]|uniref:hypothetical protein n=1 Tax=Acidihalobacter yilgarnensis TaxID=2819280 RepID=UPI000AFB029A|nr:hypothetical protein [Acidihalobacter yilgarnensis]